MTVKINERTGLRPAFLTQSHRGLEPSLAQPMPRSSWRPSQGQQTVLKVVDVLPRLTASIGFSLAANPDASVELLPGSPTTIAFTAGGKLRGLIVLPLDEEQVCHTLGLPTVTTRDLAVEALFEEQREVPSPEELLTQTWDR